MLKKTLLPLLLLASIPTVAHAGDDDNFNNRMFAGDGLATSAMAIEDLQRYGLQHLGALPADEASCRAAIEQYKDKVGPDETIFNSSFHVLSFAVNRHDGSYPDRYEIPFKKASKLCDLLASTDEQLRAAKPLADISTQVPAAVTDDELEKMDWYEAIADGELGKYKAVDSDCDAKVDAVIAAGVDPNTKVTFGENVEFTPEEIRAQCKKADAQSNENAKRALAFAEATYEKESAVYKKAGIKGKRLELFLYYDAVNSGSFYAKGCTTSVTSVKALKKAKKLFQWSTGSDGMITVTTFKFKGDRYTATDKLYTFPETAYAGCK